MGEIRGFFAFSGIHRPRAFGFPPGISDIGGHGGPRAGSVTIPAGGASPGYRSGRRRLTRRIPVDPLRDSPAEVDIT